MNELDDKTYKELREKVMWRIILRWTWVLNFLFSGMVILLLIQAILEDPSDPLGTAMGILIFASGIIIHGVLAFNVLDRVVDRALAHELKRYGLDEKPKRRTVEVGEDGELVEPDVWAEEQRGAALRRLE